MNKTLSKLNLGCGEFKKKGYVNVDCFSVTEPDVKHNLNLFPYPFEDDEFEVIEADHVLEHLDEPFIVLKELHRITKNEGVIRIKVPHFSRGFTHPEHRRSFDVSLPFYFDPHFQGGYQGVQFELMHMRLRWFCQPHLKKQILSSTVFNAGKFIGGVIDIFANLFPFFCSRLWCFWVGGFEEIEYHFLVKK